jgi:hypothetical protein
MNATWTDGYLTVNEIAEHLKLNPSNGSELDRPGRAARSPHRATGPCFAGRDGRALAQAQARQPNPRRRRSHLTHRMSSSAELSSEPNDSLAGEAPSAALNSPKAFRSSLTRWRLRSPRLTAESDWRVTPGAQGRELYGHEYSTRRAA